MNIKLVSDLDKLPEFPKEHLDKMERDREALEKKHGSLNGMRSGTSTFFASYRGKLKYEYEINGPCHARMSRFETGSVGIVSYVMIINEEFKRESEKFYDYLVNRSRFSKAFVKFDGQCFYCRTDIPSNYLMGALISTRYPWEHAHSVVSFVKMVELGMNEHVAFVVSQCFNSGFPGSAKPVRGHNSINTDSLNTLKRYTNGQFGKVNQNYTDYSHYLGVDNLWHSGDDYGSLVRHLKDLLDAHQKEEFEVVSFNPWQDVLNKYLEKKNRYSERNSLVINEDNIGIFIEICNKEFAPNE